MSEHPTKINVEKTYGIDDAGNANIERSWILVNTRDQEFDISNLAPYVIEFVNTLADVKALDSSGELEFRQEQYGSGIKIKVKPRISKLGPLQQYKMSLRYSFPNYVHKLGSIWFFADTIEGMSESPSASTISDRMEITLQVALPKLRKSFWESFYHESSPLGKELSEVKNPQYADTTIIEWKCSLSPQQNLTLRLIYGVRTNARLANFLTAVATAIVVGLVSYGMDLLKGS